MKLKGRVWKDEKFWLLEVPAFDGMTQGQSRKEALRMMESYVRDALEMPGYEISVEHHGGDEITLTVSDPKPLVALMVSRTRSASGLTMQEICDRMGKKGRNAVRQYETGKHDPSITKLQELAAAMGFDVQLDLVPRQKLKKKAG